MGLDIVAYKKLEVVENPKYDSDGEVCDNNMWTPGTSMDWSEKHFPGRGEGINSKSVYTYEDRYHFRAGSYSGYNYWRDELRKLATGTNDFQELINFADNEGVIGPVVSKKLLDDFKRNKEKAYEFFGKIEFHGEFMVQKYDNWEKAFEYASDNGAVEFC